MVSGSTVRAQPPGASARPADRRDAGIGTLVSMTLPVGIAVLMGWTLIFLAWYALGVPLGPGAPVR